jgi:hypothetical protein
LGFNPFWDFGFRTGMLEPPTLISGLHDVAMVRQSIQQGSRHLHITKHLRRNWPVIPILQR